MFAFGFCLSAFSKTAKSWPTTNIAAATRTGSAFSTAATVTKSCICSPTVLPSGRRSRASAMSKSKSGRNVESSSYSVSFSYWNFRSECNWRSRSTFASTTPGYGRSECREFLAFQRRRSVDLWFVTSDHVGRHFGTSSGGTTA